MQGVIKNFNFREMEAQKYYSPKAGDPYAKEDAMNKVFSGDWTGARKMDGFFSKFIKDEDGNMMLLSRSRGVGGDFADKFPKVPHLHSFFEKLPNGTCLLGELYFPTHEGSSEVTKVLGALDNKAIERQKNDPIHFYIFDVLAWDSTVLIKEKAETRFSYLNEIENFKIKNVEIAQYLEGKELWESIQDTLNSGGEGAVIVNKNSIYSPGSRSKKATLKIKKEVQDTIDVFVIDKNAPTRISGTTTPMEWKYWENSKTGEKSDKNKYKEFYMGESWEPVSKAYFYDWAGSFVFGAVKDGKVVPVCSISGLSEEVLSNFEKYRGKVAEIGAMEILETGGLRHPKLLRWRDDKTPKDCLWEDIFHG